MRNKTAKRLMTLLLGAALLLCAAPGTAAGSSFETTQRVLPQLVRQTEGCYGAYYDTAITADGGVVAVGHFGVPGVSDTSVIDVYDEQFNLLQSRET